MLESGGLRMCHEAVIEKKNSVISSESISAIVKVSSTIAWPS